jgi:hypothetical protein
MWSVEWISESDPFNCWNQYRLTRWKWTARLHKFELRMHFNKFGNRVKYRIREV